MVLHKMSPIKYLIHISSGSTQILSKDVILEEVCLEVYLLPSNIGPKRGTGSYKTQVLP